MAFLQNNFRCPPTLGELKGPTGQDCSVYLEAIYAAPGGKAHSHPPGASLCTSCFSFTLPPATCGTPYRLASRCTTPAPGITALCSLQVPGGVPASRQGWIARYREVHGRLSTMPDGGISLAEKTSLAKRNKGPPLEELSSLKESTPEM